MLSETDDLLAVLGACERRRVERPENSAWNRRLSRCFRLVEHGHADIWCDPCSKRPRISNILLTASGPESATFC